MGRPSVESAAGWPDHVAEENFDGRHYFMVPATLTYHQALAFRCDRIARAGKEDINDAQRFLSLLAFRWACSIRVVDIRRAGHLITAAPIREFWMPTVNNDLEVAALVAPNDERAELAVALLREAQNLYSP